MSLFRRATLRVVSATSSSTPFALHSRALTTSLRSANSSYSPLASIRSHKLSTTFRRAYATEDGERKDHEGESQSLMDTVSETAEKAKDAVTSAVSAGVASVTPDSYSSRPQRDSGRSERPERRGGFGASTQNNEPSKSLYIGNLYFDVTEQTLQKEFEKYGTVASTKIVYDGRGLSKGFGYIELGDIESATKAREALDGQVLEGRRLAVQFAIKSGGAPRRTPNSEGYTNPASKTLFIGNMSYEMSDKDLNDLFRDIKNVLDVRVAIDRRTGQPRGFAHADFLDVKSAEAAAEYLKKKEFYGRNLRIDFSAGSTGTGNRDGGERGDRRDRGGDREDRGDRRPRESREASSRY